MNLVLISIIIIYHIIIAIIDCKDIKKYKNIKITEKVRVQYYKEAVIFGWIPVFIIFVFIVLSSISFDDIGFRLINISNIGWLNIVTIIVSLFIVFILLFQSIMCLINEKYQKQMRDELNKENKNAYENMSQVLIPRTKREKKWFLVVSLTAGICEEIVWRGSLIFLLQCIFPQFNFIIVGLLTCILFGLMHSYQGMYGSIKTGVIAILFVGLYYVTDSIIPGIVLHFLFDYSSAFLIKSENN